MKEERDILTRQKKSCDDYWLRKQIPRNERELARREERLAETETNGQCVDARKPERERVVGGWLE